MPEALEQTLAFKRYLCLLLKSRPIVHMQLTLCGDLNAESTGNLAGLFHRMGLVAYAVDRRTMLLAAELHLGLLFADLAAAAGVLSRRLQAHNEVEFGDRASRPPVSDNGVQRRLKRALSAIAYVDFPKHQAFARAGFDWSRICSSPQCQ